MYLNGTEIARSNLPAGALTAGTYPTRTATTADATTWRQFTAPAALLSAGDTLVDGGNAFYKDSMARALEMLV